jgi:tricarballylate dehydrogenase
MKSEPVDFDIVVVGAGAAGTSAALSAAENARQAGVQLKILILDRTDSKNWGGNSRWTGGLFRMKDLENLPANIEEEFYSSSQGKVDRNVVQAFIKNATETIKWVSSKNVEFEKPVTHYLAQGGSYISPKGGGLAIIMALLKQAQQQDVSVAFETTAWKLALNEIGEVEGVYTRDKEGIVQTVRTHVVVLTCGGFEGNPEMLARHMGSKAYYLRMYSPGEYYNKGEGIAMVEEIGGKLSGHFGYMHVGPADPRSNTVMPLVDAFPYGIVVNKLGRRFADEGADFVDDNATEVASKILDQPDGCAFLICDQKFLAIPGWGRSLLTDQPPIEAKSIAELADKISIKKDALEQTIAQYNHSIQPGVFDPFRKDGKRTSGVEPPKSNWATPIDNPPLLCFPLVCALSHTCGGIATDAQGRVLTQDDKPIAGLFAAGEITGFYYHKYVIATSLFRAVVFGRIVGHEAVQYVMRKKEKEAMRTAD